VSDAKIPADLAGSALSRRQLLALWDVRFRNHVVVSRVALDLANAGLTTEPDFATGPLDDEVRVVPLRDGTPTAPSGLDAPPIGKQDDRSAEASETPATTPVPSSYSTAPSPERSTFASANAHSDAGEADNGVSVPPEDRQGEDPLGLLPQSAMRIGAIPSAGLGVTSVMPEDSLARAMGAMAELGYSQLPVLDSIGKLQGVVTWASIAYMHATGRTPSVLNALTSEFHVVDAATHLMSALPFIQAHGFVLVRNRAGELIGIVTTADLASEFVSVAGPFFTLGEIERRLRRCLGRVYGEEDVRQVHKDRRRSSVDQLMFSEYIRLLDDELRWKKLNWPGVDRTHFVGLLRHVKDVRNTVMHFNGGPLHNDQLAMLDRFVGILRSYDPDRSPW
jgi:CBS domain-containing protein